MYTVFDNYKNVVRANVYGEKFRTKYIYIIFCCRLFSDFDFYQGSKVPIETFKL